MGDFGWFWGVGSLMGLGWGPGGEGTVHLGVSGGVIRIHVPKRKWVSHGWVGVLQVAVAPGWVPWAGWVCPGKGGCPLGWGKGECSQGGCPQGEVGVSSRGLVPGGG